MLKTKINIDITDNELALALDFFKNKEKEVLHFQHR